MNRPFRPRPLDIYKKLPVVKSVKELDIDDSSHTSLSSNAVGTYCDIEPVMFFYNYKKYFFNANINFSWLLSSHFG